jgi:L-glyceraldehyde 3-phosphate reductase
MGALDQAIRQGKALYAGISNYPPDRTLQAYTLLKQMGHHLLIHQPKYSMLVRSPEEGLFNTLEELGVGSIPFSPLAQGLLTNKYLTDIPADSRAARPTGFLKKDVITPQLQSKLQKLNKVAQARGQSLAQRALTWILRDPRVTTVLIGASRTEQIQQNIDALDTPDFDKEELDRIDTILAEDK